MKEHYNIEISDIQLTIVSDEPEDFVNSTVEKINERVNDLIVRNKRCSKLDAALLCALDYCGEFSKAERRIRNLEAQISLYDANLKRMREEIASKNGDATDAVKSALGVDDSTKESEEAADEPSKVPSEDSAQTAASPKNEKTDKQKGDARDDMINMLDIPTDGETKSQTPDGDTGADAPDEGAPSGATKSKLEQIEMLLRR